MLSLKASGTGCVNRDDPKIIHVGNCENPEDAVITCDLKPTGAPDPVVTYIGNGKFEVRASVSGAYDFEVECCGT